MGTYQMIYWDGVTEDDVDWAPGYLTVPSLYPTLF